MYNSFSFLNVLNGISRTLNIAKDIIPVYKQLKPIVANSSKVIDFVRNMGVKQEVKPVTPLVNRPVYKVNSPTFFQ